MATLLRKGSHFTTGNGIPLGQTINTILGTGDNTIQSFNGDLYKYNQSFYVNIISPDHVAQASAADVDAINEFFIQGVTVNVTFNNRITVTLPSTTFLNDELEVGDTLGLRDSTHTETAIYTFRVTEVNYTSGDPSGTVVAILENPHADSQTVTAPIVDSNIGNVFSISSSTYAIQISVGSYYDALGRLIDSSHFTELDLGTLSIYDGGTAQLTGTTNGYYDFGRKIIELWFDTQLNADAARTALLGALPGDLVLETTLDVVTFDRLGVTKPLHIGSKNTNSSTIVTPITLPAGLTIEAGDGVEDIFLIAVNG